jgi:hypothetical protein
MTDCKGCPSGGDEWEMDERGYCPSCVASELLNYCSQDQAVDAILLIPKPRRKYVSAQYDKQLAALAAPKEQE